MSLENLEKFDVLVIGAGQAGLSIGYHLNKHRLKYVIFDRGSIANTWNSQRWDSLKLDSPASMNLLPGEIADPAAGDQFMTWQEYSDKLKNYAGLNRIPVKEYHRVTSLDKDDHTGLFEVKTDHHGEAQLWYARKVVVASGMLNEPVLPRLSASLPAGITQLHSSQYRNPGQLPVGNVLVVGSARSGSMITEELSATAHKVYLATSKVGRVPRRYRGKDITAWLDEMGFFDLKTADVTDPAILRDSMPLISGRKAGHTVSLQSLHKEGVTLMGRLTGSAEGKLYFGLDTAENIRFGDQVSSNIKLMIDGYIGSNAILASAAEPDEADVPDTEARSACALTELDMAEHGITAVIWATGLRGNMHWFNLPVSDQQSNLVHTEGVSFMKGLYYMGFPWLRKRKSGLMFGLQEDAAYIIQHLVQS